MIEITVIVYNVVIFISTVTFLLFLEVVFFTVSFIDVLLPCFFHFPGFFAITNLQRSKEVCRQRRIKSRSDATIPLFYLHRLDRSFQIFASNKMHGGKCLLLQIFF